MALCVLFIVSHSSIQKVFIELPLCGKLLTLHWTLDNIVLLPYFPGIQGGDDLQLLLVPVPQHSFRSAHPYLKK